MTSWVILDILGNLISAGSYDLTWPWSPNYNKYLLMSQELKYLPEIFLIWPYGSIKVPTKTYPHVGFSKLI